MWPCTRASRLLHIHTHTHEGKTTPILEKGEERPQQRYRINDEAGNTYTAGIGTRRFFF